MQNANNEGLVVHILITWKMYTFIIICKVCSTYQFHRTRRINLDQSFIPYIALGTITLEILPCMPSESRKSRRFCTADRLQSSSYNSSPRLDGENAAALSFLQQTDQRERWNRHEWPKWWWHLNASSEDGCTHKKCDEIVPKDYIPEQQCFWGLNKQRYCKPSVKAWRWFPSQYIRSANGLTSSFDGGCPLNNEICVCLSQIVIRNVLLLWTSLLILLAKCTNATDETTVTHKSLNHRFIIFVCCVSQV